MIAAEPGLSALGEEFGEEFGHWQRVDPRTALLYVVPVAGFGATYLVGAYGGPGVDRSSLVVEALVPLLGVVAVVIRYLTGYYAVAEGAVRWKSGLIKHRAVDIGLDRIQDVEVTRPLLARIIGLAAVNVSSAGGVGEIRLPYLDHRVADRLGSYLQRIVADRRQAEARQGFRTAPIGVAQQVSDAPGRPLPAALIHRVDSAELATWAFFKTWPACFGFAAAVIALLQVGPEALVGIVPVLPAWLFGVIKPLVDRTNLTVTIDETSLYTSEGLTTTRRTSTQRERVQLVVAHQLWLQRLRGFETVRFASADVTDNEREGSVREELALNVPVDTWGMLAATVAHRQVAGPEWFRRKPDAAARATQVRWTGLGAVVGSALGIVTAAALAAGDGGSAMSALEVLTGTAAFAALGAVGGLAFGVVRGSRRIAVEGWVATPNDLLVRNGLFRRRTLLLFAEKVQAIDVVSGPLQRRLGLVTVVVDIAPPRRDVRVVIHDVSAADGAELLGSLSSSGSVPLPNGV